MIENITEYKDNLRRIFHEKYPNINKITQTDIHNLVYLLDVELDKHFLMGDNLRMHMQPMDRFTAKMLRTKGMGYRGIRLKVLSHYFSDREAITITNDGNVYFCGWASTVNHQPFLIAFSKWLGH